MGSSLLLVLMVAVAVVARIPAARKSPLVSALLMVVSFSLFTAYLVLPPNDLAVTWPLVASLWVGVLWKLAVDGTWKRYREIRSESPRYDTELPPPEQVLMLAYNIVPVPVASALTPLFAWLFVSDLSAIGERVGVAPSPSFERFPLVAGVVSLAFLVLLTALIFALRRRNPWLITQLRLAGATLSAGEKRERLIRAALDAEPPVKPVFGPPT